MTAKPLPAGYQAALEGAAWYAIPQPGCLLISGRDRINFLQRQTTHDIRLLESQHALPTVLTTPNARILDVLYLLPGPGELITALTLPGLGATTAAYFKKRVFFMDQVEIEDISAQVAQIDLVGPGQSDITQKLGFTRQPAADEILSLECEGHTIHLLNNSAPLWIGLRLVAPLACLPALQLAFEQAGADALSPELYHLLHVENGNPQARAELNDDFTPLEIGLRSAISDSKGCYTGQEIIARQITYDKITQHLCGLRLTSLPEIGSTVWQADRSIGRVTSTALSPRFGPVALAMIKRPHHEPGTVVLVGSHADQAHEAWVSGLPFDH